MNLGKRCFAHMHALFQWLHCTHNLISYTPDEVKAIDGRALVMSSVTHTVCTLSTSVPYVCSLLNLVSVFLCYFLA